MAALETVNIGAEENDGTGDTIREGGRKINDNFTEIDIRCPSEALMVDGSNRFTSQTMLLGNAADAGNITHIFRAGTTTPKFRFENNESTMYFDIDPVLGTFNCQPFFGTSLNFQHNGVDVFGASATEGLYPSSANLDLGKSGDWWRDLLLTRKVHWPSTNLEAELRSGRSDTVAAGTAFLLNVDSSSFTRSSSRAFAVEVNGAEQFNVNPQGLATMIKARVGANNTVSGTASMAVGGSALSNTIAASDSLVVGSQNRTIYGTRHIVSGTSNYIHDAGSLSDFVSGAFNQLWDDCDYNIVGGIANNLYNASSSLVAGSGNHVGKSGTTNIIYYNVIAGNSNYVENGGYNAVFGQNNRVGDDAGAGSNTNLVIGQFLESKYNNCIVLGKGLSGSYLATTADNQLMIAFGSDTPHIFADATKTEFNNYLGTKGGRVENINTTAKTGAYTILIGDENVVCDTSAGAFTVTLPAAPEDGETHTVILDVAGNNLTIDGNGNNINGSATTVLTTVGSALTVIFNGTQWNIK